MGSVAFIQTDRGYAQPLMRLARSADLSAQTFTSVDELIDQVSTPVPCIVADSALLADMESTLLRLKEEAGCPPSGIIILSDSDDAQTRQLAHDLGAAAFFHEPVDGEALLDAIRWVHCRTDERGNFRTSGISSERR